MKMKYIIVKNEMSASSSEAAYLARAIPNGVRNRSQMVAAILGSEHFAEGTVNTVLDAAFSLTQELCADGRDVDWGVVKFLAKMHGSMPYEDSSFEDGTAYLTLDADATNTTRAALETLEPTKVSAADIVASTKVSNVMDAATQQFGVVVGNTNFVILGNGVTLDGEGEYVKAYNKKTGALGGTATVVSVAKGQRATCKFNPQLAAGDYRLDIATKGLVGETTPRIFNKNVTSIYVTPTGPTVTKVCTEGTEQDAGIIHAARNLKLIGTNLKLGATDTVTFSGTYEQAAVSGSFTVQARETNTDELLVLSYMQTEGDTFQFDDNTTVTLGLKGITTTATYSQS